MKLGRKAAAARAPRAAQRRRQGGGPDSQPSPEIEAMRDRQEAAYMRLQNIKMEEEFGSRMDKVSYVHGKQAFRVDYDFDALQDNVYDYIVVGAGFGGSVYAMRMAQKGYSVLLVEQGRKWAGLAPESDKDVFNVRWNPAYGMSGARQTTDLGIADVVSGVGVGGSSLIHTAHLERPDMDVFTKGSWAGTIDPAEMDKYYTEVERMLGVQEQPFITAPDFLAADAARHLGLGDPRPAQAAAFFGKQKKQSVLCPTADPEDAIEERLQSNPYEIASLDVPRTSHSTTRQMLQRGALHSDGNTEDRGRVVWSDPQFGGLGPARSPCTACGMCAIGCDKNAKNTLEKNYGFFAEKRYNATVMQDTKAVAVRFLGETTDDDDSRYVLDVEFRPEIDRRLFASFVSDTKYGKTKKVRLNARNVVLGCGAVETNRMLLTMRDDPLGLPDLGEKVGAGVHVPHTSTVVCTPLDNGDEGTPAGRNFTMGTTTTTYIADAATRARVEVMRFAASCSFSRYSYLPTAPEAGDVDASPFSRAVAIAKKLAAEPFDTLRWLTRGEWTRSTLVLRETRPCAGTITLGLNGKRLAAVGSDGEAASTTPLHAEKMAAHIGDALGGAYVTRPFREAVLGRPIAYDMTGGACMGEVVDGKHEVIAYPGLFVVDAAAIPSHLNGADSALTVCALAERAAAQVPVSKEGFSSPKLYDRTPWTAVEWKDMGMKVDDSKVRPDQA